MQTIYQIDKKDFGYAVAIDEVYSLIGNPSFVSFSVSLSDPFISEGSADLYKYDAIIRDGFVYDRTIKRTAYEQFLLYTEIYTTISGSVTDPTTGSSIGLTTELSGSTSATASFLLADADNIRVFESDFGRSIDMCGSLSAIGSTKTVYSLLHIDDVIRTDDGMVEIHDVSQTASLIWAIYPKNVTDISSSFDTGLNSFGWSVSINENFVAVGSPYSSRGGLDECGCLYTEQIGAVFIFNKSGSGYTFHSRLTASNSNVKLYGSCLKLDKNFDKLVVGNGTTDMMDSSVYLYEYISSSNSWSEIKSFSPDRVVENLNFVPIQQHDVNLTNGDGFGNSVTIYCSSSSDITVAVGAPYDRIYKEYSGSDCYRNGCVYVFDLIHCEASSSITSYWKQTKLFGDADAFKFNRFGHAIDMYDKNLIVSSPKYFSEFNSSYIQNTLFRSIDCDDISENDYLGMFYIYQKIDGDWNNVYSKYKPIKRYGYPYNFFAHDVCIFDENVIVGSPISIIDKIRTGIAAGYQHSVALKNDGTVVAWGRNNYGQTSVPVGLNEVTVFDEKALNIAAGYNHTVALRQDGTVVVWGNNSHGQTTVPAGLSGVTAIAAGYQHTVALKSDGTVVAWGDNGSGETTVPAGLSGVVAIAAGTGNTVALKQDGTVVAWGYDHNGQSTVPTGLSGVVAIAAGTFHTVALKSDGTVVAWGAGGLGQSGLGHYGQSSVPAGLNGVTAIAAGGVHTVALKSDGTVVAWGAIGFDYGQTNVPVGLSGVTAVAAGYLHTVVLKNDGTVVAWGAIGFDYGQTNVPDTFKFDNIPVNSSIKILGNNSIPLQNINGDFGIYNLFDFEAHHHVGNVFYKTGKMVISTRNSIFDEIFESDVNIEPVYDIYYKSKEQLYEKEIICTVNPGEFNYSTNPTSYYKPTFLLDINKNGQFDFEDCDKILRAIYRKLTGVEMWWDLFNIVNPISFTDKVESSLFYHYVSASFGDKNSVSLVNEKLTSEEYLYISETLNYDLDINSDGVTDDDDIRIIWNYFTNILTPINYNDFITSKSVGVRSKFTQASDYLDEITGKRNVPTILDGFQTRWTSGSMNPTSSYMAPYITTVGLYNGLDLIGVAKLGTPIKNEGYFPLNFIIRFDI